jgi:predicted molibdopterin-dependent oxidoreductase YjgC
VPKHGFRINSDAQIVRGERVVFTLNGHQVSAYEGETLATAMMAEDVTAMRTTFSGEQRGVFCGMGVCFDCLVVVNGVANTRACMTWVENGMNVATQSGLKPSNN